MGLQLLLLFVFGVLLRKGLYGDILPNSQDYSNVPAPLRHWNPNVTLEVSTVDTEIPFFAILSYLELMPEDTLSDHLAGHKRSCFQEDGIAKALDTSIPGKYKNVKFVSPQITRYSVISFDKASRTAQVRFDTTWQDFQVLNDGANETTSLDEIIEAFKVNSIYNISFETVINPMNPQSCPGPGIEYYPVPDNWCDHGSILYGGKVIQPQRSPQTQSCDILFSEQIQHYVRMWTDAQVLETERRKCLNVPSPNFDFNTDFVGSVYEAIYTTFYPCHKGHNGANSIIPACYDPRYSLVNFKENGKGLIIKMDIGRSAATTDVNITIEFTHWTAQFVERFSNAFRDCDYYIPLTTLNMHILIPEIVIPPERGPPWYLSILIILMLCPIIVMCLALFLLSFVRSKKVFRLDVWEWWKDNRGNETEDDKTNNDDKNIIGTDNNGMNSP